MTGSCGHDGWQAGCPDCEANERAASEAMGDPAAKLWRSCWHILFVEGCSECAESKRENEAAGLLPRESVLREIECLRVRPGDVLIVRVPYASNSQWVDELAADLDEIGLAGRSVVIRADGLEFAIAEHEPLEDQGEPR